MATLSIQNPTLADVAKRLDPNGKIDKIVELLNQSNGILEDATFIEGNLPTGHRTTVRTGLPQPTWRKLYGGVQPTRSTTAQVTDNCGMLEDYAEVDKALADLNGNTAAFRLSEDRPHIESINQEVASTMIYGNEGTNPAKFTGLAPRYNSLSAESGENIINGGGTGSDNTSIWLVTWGENTIHGIYPKGSKAGLHMEDKGQVTIENADGNGGRMEGYRTHYKWDLGLTVRDWRYGARIANIDVSALTDPATAKDATQALIELMIQASERIPNFGMGRAAWYVNRTIREKLRMGILNKTANNLTWETVAGKRVMMFDDIPVRRTDAILNTEAAVS
ncbi:major capsid protein [Alcaligenes aquatilis]|uniref:major capsid protein n=1 Tax=Alcaligenes aquatilis TaxID=323284 RepID=UPI003F8FCE17